MNIRYDFATGSIRNCVLRDVNVFALLFKPYDLCIIILSICWCWSARCLLTFVISTMHKYNAPVLFHIRMQFTFKPPMEVYWLKDSIFNVNCV